MFKAFLSSESGAAAMEYASVASLVSIVAFVALVSLGGSLNTAFTSVNEDVAGAIAQPVSEPVSEPVPLTSLESVSLDSGTAMLR